MKINSLNIASFGKFKDFKIDFSDGFNLIYGENEAGKSTIMAFIKMMFYGNSGKSSDIEKNPRKKYLPWDTSLMAGSIDFTHNGYDYRLEREFKGSNATDRIVLKNLTLDRTESLSGKSDVGSEIFGLSIAAFEKSVFVGGLGAPEKNSAAEGEISSKLSNIATTGDEDVSAEQVSSRLKKAKEALMSRSGKIGAYDKASAQLSELNLQIKAAADAESKARTIESEIAEKETELAQVSAKGNRCFEIMKKAELFKKKANLEIFIEAAEQKASALKSLTLPDQTVVTKEYTDALKKTKQDLDNCAKQLEEKLEEEGQIKQQLQSLTSSFDEALLASLLEQKASLQTRLLELKSEQESLRQTSDTRKAERGGSKIKPILIISGLILALICGISAALSFSFFTTAYLPIFIIEVLGAVIGLILLIVGIILKNNSKEETPNNIALQNKLTSDIEQMQDKYSEISEHINSLLVEKNTNKALYEARQSELLKKQEAVLDAKNQLFDIKERLSRLCEPFGSVTDIEKIISEIEGKLSTISSAEIKYNLAADGTNCQSLEEAKARLEALSSDCALKNLSADEVSSAKDEFKRHTDISSRLREELALLKGQLKTVLESGQTLPVLEAKKAELEEKLSSQKEFCDAVDIAAETLTESFAAVRQSFSTVLEEKTSRIFEGLTDKAYSSVDISKELDISVNKQGVFGTKDWQYLSSGTQDQAYLSLRLALTELMSEDEALPVVMDDVLAQYDDTRSDRAMSFLNGFSSGHQIILFTCHENVKNLAEKLNIKTINL